ncbi:MAG: flagellin lysine-N-methylase [Clostridia bacterium]|nr:flagellin lysine-N-methylase [Clostridia bacterium]
MKQTNDFLIPDYFPEFHCKIGNCRTACCQGWPVSVSMENYFTLLGIDCPPDLRSRLDVGLRMADHPTPEEYARFNPRWNGDCPMRYEDGRCALHAELGEDILPEVCRLYPRGIRHSTAEHELPECSCANSCEATLELFLHRTEPIRFITRRLTLDMPPAAKRTSFFPSMNREQEIRLFFIRILQDRSLPLYQRIAQLCGCVEDMDTALNAGDADAVQSLLDGNLPLYPIPEQLPFAFALNVAESMVDLLDHRSSSIHDLGEAALAAFGNGDEAQSRYDAAKAHFENAFPQWEIFFEHILVNHLFFDRFPFQDRPVTLTEECIALCAVYTLMRFLCLGCLASQQPEDDTLVDTMAAAFRLIQHSDFDRTAARMLKNLHCTSPAQLHALISL